MSEHRNVPVTVERPDTVELPALIRNAGGAARFAFGEFFHWQIRNPSTRKAYLHTIRLFSDWCGTRGLKLVRLKPADVRQFLDSLPVTLPTPKLHLAALLRFFDRLVMRHILILNPSLSVRSERYQVVEGKTPEITFEHARRLLKSNAATHDVELGYVPVSKVGAELLFDVISTAYERLSLIVTTNLLFENWTEVLGSERLTGAALDRLTHRCHILECSGNSYRLQDAKRRRQKLTAKSSSPAAAATKQQPEPASLPA